jgi:hypothetical protein
MAQIIKTTGEVIETQPKNLRKRRGGRSRN